MTSTEQIQDPAELLSGRTRKFSMRGVPLLAEGTTNDPLAICESLWIHAKVYAEGGENALHAHTSDDHAFFVLGGRARFYDGDGTVTEVGPFEGIAIPRNVLYRFESVPPENLVILRMGGAKVDWHTLRSMRDERQAPDGSVLDSQDPRNHPNAGPAAKPARQSGEFFAP
jgi:mannose-6-phosphate isomerase-like protein (cupin superfamily)